MTWVRIDDAALSHPKIARAGVDGFGVWMGGLAYANRHVTDGFIPSDCLALLVPSVWKLGETRLVTIATRLVTLNLWHVSEGGWLIHDYAEYQEQALRVNVADRRERDAERKRKSRSDQKRRGADGGHSVTPADGHNGVTPQVSARVTSPVTTTSESGRADARPSLSQPPDPTRPDPTRPSVTDVTDARAPQGFGLPQVREVLLDAWRAAGKPVDRGFADHVSMTRLLTAHPSEAELRRVAKAFLSDEDEWLVTHKHPLAWLGKHSSRYVETRGAVVRPNRTYTNRSLTGAEVAERSPV